MATLRDLPWDNPPPVTISGRKDLCAYLEYASYVAYSQGMSTEISYRDFRDNLADILNRIEYRREAFDLTRRGKKVANVRPVVDDLIAIAEATGADRIAVLTALDALLTKHGPDNIVVSEESGTVTANAGIVIRSMLGSLSA